MERFVCGLGIELDAEAFVKCCRGNMDLSEDGASVPSLDVQQMGVEDEEEDGAEYVEYTEAPEFYVVDAECYYGEVNMESVAEENPWADMGDGASSVVEEKTWEACMGGCGVWLKGGGWGVCHGCYKKGHKGRTEECGEGFALCRGCGVHVKASVGACKPCLLYTSPSPRD